MQNSLRSASAVANVAARSGSQTIWTRPSRSRRSMKMTPPWSRRRWTQPVSVTVWPRWLAVDAAAVVSAFHMVLRIRIARDSCRDSRRGRGQPARTARQDRRDRLRRRCPVNFGKSPARLRAPERARSTAIAGAGGGSGMRAGRDDAHRDHVLQRLVDGHVEFAHARLRHDDEVAGGRVRRRRHVDGQCSSERCSATAAAGVPVRKAMDQLPSCGNSTSSALRNALPESDSSVSLTCFTDE